MYVMTEEEKIEKIIKDGHLIANKIKAAQSVSEINDLDGEIKKFSSFVDENFGTSVDYEDEKSSDLTAMIYMAAEEKARQLEYYPSENHAGNEDVLDFESMLDSRKWTAGSYGEKL